MYLNPHSDNTATLPFVLWTILLRKRLDRLEPGDCDSPHNSPIHRSKTFKAKIQLWRDQDVLCYKRSYLHIHLKNEFERNIVAQDQICARCA